MGELWNGEVAAKRAELRYFFLMGAAWVPKVPGGSPFSQLKEFATDVLELKIQAKCRSSMAETIEATTK